MADLILNLNLGEIKKRDGLILEIYEGTIPYLKSKQFSGQLRSVNLETIDSADNITDAELDSIKSNMKSAQSVQIGNNKYILSSDELYFLQSITGWGCLFYKDKGTPMYMVERLIVDININRKDCKRSAGYIYYYDKTDLHINVDTDKIVRFKKEKIVPNLYVDIASEKYTSQLIFDYGDSLIRYGDEQIRVNDQLYRDFGFEKKTLDIMKGCNWKINDNSYFQYSGKNISDDLIVLIENGFNIFTNDNKKISVGKVKNISISYGIDWFDLNGKISFNDSNIDISKLVDLNKTRNNWISYKGDIIIAPNSLNKLNELHCIKKNGSLEIDNSDIIGVADLAYSLNVDKIKNLDKIESYNDINAKVPSGIWNILRDYQKTGVRWLLSLKKNNMGGCLADDMGLGKTLQIIAFLSDDSFNSTLSLIVVPKTLLENWKREFNKFAPMIKVYIYHAGNRDVNLLKESRVTITTHATLYRDIKIFSKINFETVVVDEAQNIKNASSKAYKAVEKTSAANKILMTGTPLENNLREYWNLMRIANKTNITYKEVSNGLDQAEVVKKVRKITAPFLLRRRKQDVLKELPNKVEQTVYCNLEDEQELLYNNILCSIRHEIKRKVSRYEIHSSAVVLKGLLYLQEICCHPKLVPIEYNTNGCSKSAKFDLFLSMVYNLQSAHHKIVVFSRFTKILDIMQAELEKNKYHVFYLSGKTTDRQKIVDDFERSRDGIFLISLKAGGVGLNLVSADTAIIYDPWWNPAAEEQAADRLYRIGQKRNVTIYKLIVANSIEEKVQQLQKNKRQLFDDIMDGHESPTSLTLEDLIRLIGEE